MKSFIDYHFDQQGALNVALSARYRVARLGTPGGLL
jgi:hypothetical protein